MSHPLLAVKRDTRIPEQVLDKARTLWDNSVQDLQCFVNVLSLFLDHYDDPLHPSGTSAGAIADLSEYGDAAANLFAFGIALPVADQLQFSILRSAVSQTLVKRFYSGRVMFNAKSNQIQLQIACWKDAAYRAGIALTTQVPQSQAPRARKRGRTNSDETSLDDIGFADPSALALFKEMIDELIGAKSSFQTMDYEFGKLDGVGHHVLLIKRFGDVRIEFLVQFYERFKFHVDDMVFIEKDMWIVLKSDSTISFNTKFIH
jgi:hypothetical protein